MNAPHHSSHFVLSAAIALVIAQPNSTGPSTVSASGLSNAGDDVAWRFAGRPPGQGRGRQAIERAGLMTYPNLRTVWIIGSRPDSIFLRR